MSDRPEGDKQPVGRPSMHTPEMASEICRRLANGESLRQICRTPGMPDESTVREWARNDHEGFSPHYERARELQLDAWADEQIDIADDGSNDWIEREHRDGRIEVVPDREHIQRSTLRISVRQWIMERTAPKRFGPRNTTDMNLNTDPNNISDTQLAAIATRGGAGSSPPPPDQA